MKAKLNALERLDKAVLHQKKKKMVNYTAKYLLGAHSQRMWEFSSLTKGSSNQCPM